MATAAAAVVARARREIQHHFFEADAVRPDRAVAWTPPNRTQARQFERMRGQGIIRDAGGRYWMDVVAYDVDIQRRYRLTRIVLLLVCVALVAELALVWGLRAA